MSCNRENVTWQSADGTWNLGFYEFEFVNEDSEDFDHEWDVEYLDHFNWVSTGHPTEQAAERSWRGANPGGTTVYVHSERTAEACAKFDGMAADCRQRQAEARRTGPRW